MHRQVAWPALCTAHQQPLHCWYPDLEQHQLQQKELRIHFTEAFVGEGGIMEE